MMNNMNPNQTKVTTTAFAEGEEHVLSAEQAELLFGGGTIFRVQAPGPLKGTWVVVKVNKKSIKISSLVGPDGCLLYTSPSPRDRQKSRMPSSA